jgi:hypothetical protein
MRQLNLLKSREKVQNMDKGVMNDLIAKIWKPEREGENKERVSQRPGTILGRFFIQSALIQGQQASIPFSAWYRRSEVDSEAMRDKISWRACKTSIKNTTCQWSMCSLILDTFRRTH